MAKRVADCIPARPEQLKAEAHALYCHVINAYDTSGSPTPLQPHLHLFVSDAGGRFPSDEPVHLLTPNLTRRCLLDGRRPTVSVTF